MNSIYKQTRRTKIQTYDMEDSIYITYFSQKIYIDKTDDDRQNGPI